MFEVPIKIAMIEDNPTVMAVNEAVLRKEEFIYTTDVIDKFSNSDMFFKEFDKDRHYYDLIISDHDLGRASMIGLDILISALESGYRGKTVLLTSDDSIALREVMNRFPQIGYIIKNNIPGEQNMYTVISNIVLKIKVHKLVQDGKW